MHPALTYLILKRQCLMSPPSSLNRVKPQGKPLPSNLCSGFSTLLWKSSDRGTYLVLVVLQQWLEGLVGRLFILHVLSVLGPVTSCVGHICAHLPWLEAVPSSTVCFQSVVCTMWLQQYFVSPLLWQWCWLQVRWPWLEWLFAHL